MRSAIPFLIICFAVTALSPACISGKWEQLLASKPGENRAVKAYEEAAFEEKPAPEPLLTPGQYELEAKKVGNSFIVWVPFDYSPDYSWPVIFLVQGGDLFPVVWDSF